MKRHQSASRAVIIVFILVIGLLLTQFGATPAKADLPTDGRINLVPWVNSLGAVAVYCVDRNGGHNSYTGGYILVTNATGQTLLKATEAQINQAGVNPNHDVVILSTGLYTLFRQPDRYFRLESAPDLEGKTFLGTWHDCWPVVPPVGAAPAPASGPTCVDTGEDWFDAYPVLCIQHGHTCNEAEIVGEFGSVDAFCKSFQES